MPTYLANVPYYAAHITADFRNCIRATRNAFLSCSWVDTFPSGAIDTLTVVTPTAGNQVRGYDVFKFNDSLGSFSPIYCKVSYGSAGAVGDFRLNFQVATQHDASGSLAGSVGTATTHYSGGQTATSQSLFMATGGEGYFSIITAANQAGNASQYVFGMERLVDNFGTPTGSGAWWFALVVGPTKWSQVIMASESVGTASNRIAALLAPRVPTAHVNGRIVPGLFFPFAGYLYNYSPNFIHIHPSDINYGSEIVFQTYGTEKRFRALLVASDQFTNWHISQTTTAISVPLLRWED